MIYRTGYIQVKKKKKRKSTHTLDHVRSSGSVLSQGLFSGTSVLLMFATVVVVTLNVAMENRPKCRF